MPSSKRVLLILGRSNVYSANKTLSVWAAARRLVMLGLGGVRGVQRGRGNTTESRIGGMGEEKVEEEKGGRRGVAGERGKGWKVREKEMNTHTHTSLMCREPFKPKEDEKQINTDGNIGKQNNKKERYISKNTVFLC